MSVSDPVADMLTKIRNASMARHESVDVSSSKGKLEIIKIMKSEGYIANFKEIEVNNFPYLRIFLKYDEKKNPVLHGLERVSTPGRRMYSGYKDMPRVYNGFGTLIVSTSKGITTGKKAAENKVGGELICKMW